MTAEAKPPKTCPSGASKRKKKARAEDAAAGLSPNGGAPPGDDGRWARDFTKAGKPDLKNPDTDLDYTRKLQLIVLQQMATTPFPSQAQQNAWRRIREMSATVGMTSNRAALEAKVKKLQAALLARQSAGGAIEMIPGSQAKKSPNARGVRRVRSLPPPEESPPAEPPPEKSPPAEPPKPEPTA